MILNKSKIYAKVWKVTPSNNGKFIDLQITTSEKDENGEYINSGWFPRVIGHALITLKELQEGDRIEITSSKFTNERKELENGNKKSYFRFLIFEATILNDVSGAIPPSTAKEEKKAAFKSKLKPMENKEEDPF